MIVASKTINVHFVKCVQYHIDLFEKIYTQVTQLHMSS